MKRILLITILILNSLHSEDFIDISFKDFVAMISYQENITIVYDKDIDKTFSVFISDNIKPNTYFDIFLKILANNDLALTKSNEFYMIKQADKTQSFIHSRTFRHLQKDEIDEIMKLTSFKYNFVSNLNAIFIDCNNNDFEVLTRIFNKYDIEKKQVKIKITIVDTNLNKVKDYGIENLLKFQSNSLFFDYIASPFSVVNNIDSGNRKGLFSTIKFMNNNNLSDILTNTTISIFNNKNSKLEIVKNLPYKKSEITTNTSIETVSNTIEYKDVGLKLNLLPIINKDNVFIDLDLILENIIDSSATPTTSKRHINQYLKLEKGSIFILTGFNQTNKIEDKDSAFPFFKETFFLKWFFNSEYKNEIKSTLTIFLEII